MNMMKIGKIMMNMMKIGFGSKNRDEYDETRSESYDHELNVSWSKSLGEDGHFLDDSLGIKLGNNFTRFEGSTKIHVYVNPSLHSPVMTFTNFFEA